MRRTLLASVCLLAALDGCRTSPLGLGPAGGELDGSWGWQYNGNPAGSSVTLTLATAGSAVSGTGEICGIGPGCTPGPVTVTGTHVLSYGPFSLTMIGAGGYVATYRGRFVATDRLQGTWTEGAESGTSTFDRCTAVRFC